MNDKYWTKKNLNTTIQTLLQKLDDTKTLFEINIVNGLKTSNIIQSEIEKWL